MLDLKLLHQALTLARHGNFARAAEALDMSQPALSRSIAGLESALGAKLFKRTQRGVHPTPFGERFLHRGNELLTGAAELEREIQLMQGVDGGVLRVGAGLYPADLCIGTAIGRLAMKHPQLRIELFTEDWRMILERVQRTQIDIAVVELSVAELDTDLHTVALPRHGGAFCCRANHPLLAEPVLAIQRVFEFPFVSPKLPARSAERFYRLAKTGTIDSTTGDYVPPIKVDTVALAKSIVLASDAVTLAPVALIAEEVRARQLVMLPIREPWLHTNYGFVYLKGRVLAPGTQAFIAEVNAVEAELVKLDRRALVMVT